MPTYPFEVSLPKIMEDQDRYIDAVFSCLESEFLVMPKGNGFVEYPVFEHGYEALKKATGGFNELDPATVLPVAMAEPIALVVLRTMLGFTPPEWGYVTTQRAGVSVSQGFARSIDRKIRMEPETALRSGGVAKKRIEAMVQTACRILSEGAPEVEEDQLHRLDKADTRRGRESIKSLAHMGAPYAMLLYERFLGRPFASHRDSISELVGDLLELAIEDALTKAGVSYRKTKRAERIDGFDQTPDFIIPDEFNPQVVIEAKITEDDGTARDKVTRIQHLGELSLAGQPEDSPKFEVIGCIGGRGFGVRREDMKKLIIACRGKVFTSNTLDRLVENTRIREFCTR